MCDFEQVPIFPSQPPEGLPKYYVENKSAGGSRTPLDKVVREGFFEEGTCELTSEGEGISQESGRLVVQGEHLRQKGWQIQSP